jgi:hypothetical protein
LRDGCRWLRRLRLCWGFWRGGFLDSLQHIAGLGNFRKINLGLELFRGCFGARLIRSGVAFTEVLANFFSGIGINGARMALLLRDSDARQQVENRLAFDLELSR